jgi:hypothetical protein
MTGKPETQSHRRSWLLFGGIWLLLWLVPWDKLPSIQEGNVLALVTDMFRLGIALALFMIPGVLLYFLINKSNREYRISLSGLLPIGMTFSITIIGVIGLLGRVLGLSFVVVKMLYMLFGLAEIGVIAYSGQSVEGIKKMLADGVRSGVKNAPLLLALILAAMMTFHAHLFFIDDSTYLAYLTNWQSSSQLGFQNLVHEVNVVEQNRFWLAIFPMGQAILADLSGLPGILLLGSYLELYFVPLAVITGYWFSRKLGFSRKKSGFVVLFQITLFAWMLGSELPVGLWFYQSMAEDKVFAVFVLAPVYIFLGLEYVYYKQKLSWVLFFISGISLVFTHPIILFFSSFILFGMGLFACIYKKANWMQILSLLVTVIVFLFPFLVIRVKSAQYIPYVNVSAVMESNNYELFVNIISDRFYGLNPNMLKLVDLSLSNPKWDNFYQIFRYLPILIILFAFFLALIKLKNGPKYWYITSSLVLILIAVIPYTGWVLGMFVSARMLSRTTWFLPLGMASILLIGEILRFLPARIKSLKNKKINFAGGYSNGVIGMAFCLILISPIIFGEIFPNLQNYFHQLNYYKQMAQVGTYIDIHTSEPTMVLGLEYVDSLFLPGISSKVRMISFREENVNPQGYFMSAAEKEERLAATNILRTLDNTISSEERCSVLEKFQIKFVLSRPDQSSLFLYFIEPCSNTGQIVFATNDFRLIEIGEYEPASP